MTDAERKAAKAEYDRKRRAEKREEIAAAKRAYYLANKDKENARVQAWVETNRDRSNEIKQAWKVRNPDAEATPRHRERRAAYMRRYRVFRPETHRLNTSLRRRGVSHATPPWASRAALRAVYVRARQEGLHVDHVIPLRGANVCGLHVDSNLQLLPPTENRRKGNRYAD